MKVTLVRALVATPLALALALLPGVGPQIAVACSCAASDDPVRDAAADPNTVIFAGVAQPPGVRGDVPITLTRWFKGPPPAVPVVLLDGAGFLDPNGGMCGTHAPTPGREWVFVTGPTERATYGVSLCSPHGPVGEPHGAELLGAAIARYGPGTVAAVEPGADPPGPNGLAPELVLGATLGAAVLVLALAAVAGIIRSRPREPEPPTG
jgi:hypothetical protein